MAKMLWWTIKSGKGALLAALLFLIMCGSGGSTNGYGSGSLSGSSGRDTGNTNNSKISVEVVLGAGEIPGNAGTSGIPGIGSSVQGLGNIGSGGAGSIPGSGGSASGSGIPSGGAGSVQGLGSVPGLGSTGSGGAGPGAIQPGVGSGGLGSPTGGLPGGGAGGGVPGVGIPSGSGTGVGSDGSGTTDANQVKVVLTVKGDDSNGGVSG